MNLFKGLGKGYLLSDCIDIKSSKTSPTLKMKKLI